MTRALSALVLLAGCTSDTGFPGATGVGNPGSSKQQLARGAEVTVTLAEVYSETLEVQRCSEDPVVVDLDATIDLLDDAPVEVGGGHWCLVEVQWQAPLVVQGAAEDGEPGKGTFELILEVDELVLVPQEPPFVDETDFIIEVAFPGWFGKETLDLEDGRDVVVDAAHPLHDGLAQDVAEGSALYIDANGDGILSNNERSAGPSAAGPRHDPRDTEDDD